MIIRQLYFSWDEKKNQANQQKHGVSFEEAKTVFYDDLAMEYPDPDHSDDEQRFILVGKSHLLRLLLVCHCFRNEESEIRIISARRLTRTEHKEYAQRV